MKVYKHGIYDYITVVEIPKRKIKKIDFALCEEPKETLKEYYDRQTEKPDLLINGGIFNLSDGDTYFNFWDDDKIVSGWHWYDMGMGIVDGELRYGNVSGTAWKDFVTGYPPLIENGRALPITYATELNYKTRRSVLAYNADTVFLIAVESPGMKFEAVQDVLLNMGVTHAIALDGGGSTKILQDGKSITSTVYNRAVDNVVAVWLKEPLRRVQVGAFTNKLYALAMQVKIRALKDDIGAGYKNAYVRQIGNYYKVQVGAFSTDVAAQRVVDDLMSKGYNAYITRE